MAAVRYPISMFRIALNLHPANISFLVTVTVDLTGTSDVYNDKYHDQSTFRVDVKKGLVTVPTDSIHNQAPTVTPSSGSGGGSTAVWIAHTWVWSIRPVGRGLSALRIQRATGSLHSHLPNRVQWGLAGKPLISLDPHTLAPYPQIGVPLTLSFEMKDEFQVIDPLAGTGAAGEIRITVTPIH